MQMRLVFTVVGFQIRVNHFFPTLFRGETNTSSGAKTQCGSNVVEHVPKENLGKGETMPGGLVESTSPMLQYKRWRTVASGRTTGF